MWTPPWAQPNRLGKLIFDASAPGSPPTMTVWRVQDKDGTGVYGGNGTLYRATMSADKILTDSEYVEFDKEMGRQHPPPLRDFVREEWEDVPPKERERFLFGFLTPKDAYDWFGPIHMMLMEQAGAELAPRRAKKVYLSMSGRQLIFLPAD